MVSVFVSVASVFNNVASASNVLPLHSILAGIKKRVLEAFMFPTVSVRKRLIRIHALKIQLRAASEL